MNPFVEFWHLFLRSPWWFEAYVIFILVPIRFVWHSSKPSVDLTVRVRDLEELIVHAWIHSGYRDCGYDQMTYEQRCQYDDVVGRARDITEAKFDRTIKRRTRGA